MLPGEAQAWSGFGSAVGKDVREHGGPCEVAAQQSLAASFS